MKNTSEAKFQKTCYKIYEIFDSYCEDGVDNIVFRTDEWWREHLPELKRQARRLVLKRLFDIPVDLWKIIIFGC